MTIRQPRTAHTYPSARLNATAPASRALPPPAPAAAGLPRWRRSDHAAAGSPLDDWRLYAALELLGLAVFAVGLWPALVGMARLVLP